MESQKFKLIESNLIKLLEIITSSQNLLRYIKYLDNTPLSPDKPDITDTLINENIMLVPYDSNLLDEAIVKVFINPLYGELETEPTGIDTCVIDICIPNKFWILKGYGQIRVFRIAHEISRVIDNLNVSGHGKVKITNYKISKLSDKISCLSLFIKINSVTIKG